MQEGLLIALGTVIGAIVAGAVAILNAWHKNRLEARKSTYDEQADIIARQEKQIARLQTQVDTQQVVIMRILALNTDCEVRQAELFGWVERGRDWMLQAAKQLGPNVAPVPDLPPRPQRRAPDVEFLARETAQATELLRAANEASQAKGAPNASPGR